MRHFHLVGVVLVGLLAGWLAGVAAAPAWGDGGPTLRPPTSVRFLPDDIPYTWGNAAAAPDVSCGWETTGAEDHLACVIPTGAGLLVSSDADVDRSGAIAPGATYLGVCSDDAAAQTECVTLRHDGTDGIVQVPAGVYRVHSAGEEYHRGLGSVAGTDTFDIVHGMTGRSAALWLAEGTSNSEAVLLSASFAFDQVLLGCNSARGGFQLIVGSSSFYATDHGYAAEADPALYVQSSGDPTVGAGVGAAVKIQYVTADDAGYVGTPAGGGPLRFNPATASVRLPRIDVAVPAEPHVCDAANFGALVMVNDNGDAAAAQVCICTKTNDVPTYDWWNLAAGVACTLI